MSIAINVIALLRDHGDLSVADIVGRLRCSHSAVFRTLQSLEHKKLVERRNSKVKHSGAPPHIWRLTIR